MILVGRCPLPYPHSSKKIPFPLPLTNGHHSAFDTELNLGNDGFEDATGGFEDAPFDTSFGSVDFTSASPLAEGEGEQGEEDEFGDFGDFGDTEAAPELWDRSFRTSPPPSFPPSSGLKVLRRPPPRTALDLTQGTSRDLTAPQLRPHPPTNLSPRFFLGTESGK